MSFLQCCKRESPGGKGIKEMRHLTFALFFRGLSYAGIIFSSEGQFFQRMVLSAASESAVNLNIFRNFFHRLWCFFGELEFQDAILKGSFDILVF